ncbi:DUF3828 domain-containing protein [Bizionia sediminis]|uniref:DUF3828 domain-containing protein n=1 Tax=Bizionia sediminis TaxID=1737064 RepID=A0ABW5KSH4_9FLAO
MKHFFILMAGILLASCVNNTSPKTLKQTALQTDSDTITGFQTDSLAMATTALTFINSYVANCNKMRAQTPIVAWTNNQALASQTLKVVLEDLINTAEAKNPDIGLGFDPFFDAQDYPDAGFQIKSLDTNSNFITLKGKSPWDTFELTIKVVQTNQQWLVDGVGIVNIPETMRAKR